ncbi:hypothetical protein IGI04_042307, partial [Brassica rapa subsp. trilocularis]
MNQALVVVATKSCSLLFDLYLRIHMNRTLMIAATKSRSNSFCWNPYEASLNGCSHQGRNRERKGDKSTQGFTFQTCLKNSIPCIPSPKTSSCVKFSVGGQLWFLQTISASVSVCWRDGPAANGELARTLLLLEQRH